MNRKLLLEKQIEEAFHFRGNVTIAFHDGNAIEAFVYNREFDNPRLKMDNFIEVYLAGDGAHQTYPIKNIGSVTLTGEDCAAGKSYQEWLEKKEWNQS